MTGAVLDAGVRTGTTKTDKCLCFLGLTPSLGVSQQSKEVNCTVCHGLFIVVEKNHAVKGNGVLAWGSALTMFLML